MRLGLDIGGTKMEAVVLDERGTVVYRERYPTPKESYQAFLRGIVEVITLARAAISSPLSIGLGIPGTVDSQTGLVKNSNILVLNQQPFARELEAILGQPVAITNDANCFTLSEAMDGSGKGYDVVFGVILGTGCGGGISINQRVISGPNACSGEWGHNALPHYTASTDGDGVACYCGQQNCIENFISGSGLERQYYESVKQHSNVLQIMKQVESGEAQSIRLWLRFQDQLARSLAGIINMLDPDVIVIGGGLSNIRSLYDGLQERVAKYVFGNHCCTPIVAATHGDSSGVRGAAWLGEQVMKA
jgi:fructokinase